jgi:hypothetical protein
MPKYRTTGSAALTVALVAASFCSAPTTCAGPAGQLWNGTYAFNSFLSQKTGTSLAARQPETDSGAVYTMSTTCSAAGCIATVVDGPLPKNPTLPRRDRYTWDGMQWLTINDWQWDCLCPDGSIESDPTRSWTAYRPQPDGTLIGAWHNEIHSGTCQGTLDAEMVAAPF